MPASSSQVRSRLSRTEAKTLLKTADRLLKSSSRANRRASIVLFEAAALAGDGFAAWQAADCWDEGIGVARDRSRARDWYRWGVRLGDVSCMTGLGVLEWNAGNRRAAIRLYRRAAARGEEHAQHNLGLVFLERSGVRWQRYAFELFTVSARNGHPNAAYRLACCYFYGEGTRKNMARSLAWFQRAAKLGSVRARKYLKSLGTRARWSPR